jgi:hypothetical protein
VLALIGVGVTGCDAGGLVSGGRDGAVARGVDALTGSACGGGAAVAAVDDREGFALDALVGAGVAGDVFVASPCSDGEVATGEASGFTAFICAGTDSAAAGGVTGGRVFPEPRLVDAGGVGEVFATAASGVFAASLGGEAGAVAAGMAWIG